MLFGFDRSNLSNAATGNLNKLVSVLNVYPDTDIEVQGHTDSQGSDAYNMDLSKRRAQVVSNYLVSNDINSHRVSIHGFGESAPKYNNDTDNGRTQNRRVEFLISANEKMKAAAEKQAGK